MPEVTMVQAINMALNHFMLPLNKSPRQLPQYHDTLAKVCVAIGFQHAVHGQQLRVGRGA